MKQRILITIVFLLILVSNLYFQARATDEYTYLSTAVKMNAGTVSNLELGRFPGYPFLLAILFRINQSENAALILNFVLLAGIAAFTSKIGKELKLDSKIIFLATITSPFLVFFSSRILTETAFSFLVILATYFLIKQKSFLAGVIAGITFTFRYTGGLIGIAFLIIELTKKPINWKSIMFFTLGGLIGVTPLLFFNYEYTHNPIGLILTFLGQQHNENQASFSLPDKIPSYILLTPIIAGALIIVLIKGKKFKPNKKILIVFLTCINGMEAYSLFGIFNVPLLRYITVFSPLAILLIFDVARDYNKKFVLGLIFLNLLIGITGTVYFNTHYEKNVNYKLSEDYVKNNCKTAYSNLATLTQWTNNENTLLENTPDCILYTHYEGNLYVPSNYKLEKQFARIEVYRKNQ